MLRRKRSCQKEKQAWKGLIFVFFILSAVSVRTVTVQSQPGSRTRVLYASLRHRLLGTVPSAEEQLYLSRRRLGFENKKSICKSVYQPYNKGVFAGKKKADEDETWVGWQRRERMKKNNRARGKDYGDAKKVKVREGSSCTTIMRESAFIFVISIFISLYLFIGIAIVCDELFVSALEIISEKWNLSDDVSGATLMAAGGSAPELATSFIGTFQGSTVGLGTIVGSAVFNVLFVIGMCALQTPDAFAPLKLTWWPLFRDCTYYVITLFCLAFWFIGPTVGAISFWEALLQFALYIGYVYLMSKNEKLEKWVKRSFGSNKVEPQSPEAIDQKEDVTVASDPNFLKPSTFRGTIMQLITKGTSLQDTAGVGVVSKIKGDVTATFQTFDLDSDGKLNFQELRNLLKLLGDPDATNISDEEVAILKTQLDSNGDGTICPNEFTKWYITSESRLKAQAKEVFDAVDLNKNGSIEVHEVKSVVEKLAESKPHLKTGVEKVVNDFKKSVATSASQSCSFKEFQQWYETTVFWQSAQQEAQEAQEACEGMWIQTMTAIKEAPTKPFGEALTILILFPLNISLAATIPDCRIPGQEKYCYLTFGGAIAWIGFYSYFMVMCIENIGCYLGISSFIMGLIPLAAGTSVPDMLSSVVVAKQGKGDMAVSSSIGSNIFDVAVGLPLPWMVFTAYHFCPMQVGGTPMNNALSVFILLAMVILVIVSIAACGWEMSKGLGFMMFSLYFVFCGQEIYRAFFL